MVDGDNSTAAAAMVIDFGLYPGDYDARLPGGHEHGSYRGAGKACDMCSASLSELDD